MTNKRKQDVQKMKFSDYIVLQIEWYNLQKRCYIDEAALIYAPIM